jgi:flagellar protein FliJ
MNRARSWDRLKEAAAKRRDAQAQRLTALTRERDEAQQRLETLIAYRSDYQTRLSQASSRGIDLLALRNYQSFLAQLERAIAQQTELVEQAEQRVHGAKADWTSERQRVDSFQALDDRQLSSVARREAQREQKLTDEWAARAGQRQSDPDH